jgi:hypothetical protein
MKLIGDTNHMVYPRSYFSPEKEDIMMDERLNWCYGVDQNNQPIIFRINSNIEKISFDKETKKPKAVIGENARIRGEREGKVMPAIWNFADEGEKNFFCASYEENSPTYGDEGGVILISKSILIDNESLTALKQDFLSTYGFEMPEAPAYECGYARVLNQGVPEDLSSKQKIKMRKRVATPEYGIGRLEMRAKKPSENTLMFSLANQIKRFQGNIHQSKQHYHDFRRKLSEFSEIKKQLKQNPDNQELVAQKNQMLNELNQFEGVELMRDFTQSNRAYAEWGKVYSEIKNLEEVLEKNPNDEAMKTEISTLREKADHIAIEYNIADFKVKIFKPSDIVSLDSFDIPSITQITQGFYDKYTQGGSYGGVYIRVKDNKGRTIPKMSFEMQCKFLGRGRVSDAMSDMQYALKRDECGLINTFINQGISFDIIPFISIKPPGVGKKAYIKIAKSWLGDPQNGIPSMRNIYQDALSGEEKNTYIVVSRRRTEAQPDSAFVVNVFATGFDGEAPHENCLDSNGEATIQIRKK